MNGDKGRAEKDPNNKERMEESADPGKERERIEHTPAERLRNKDERERAE